jgi:hypothetical protein
MNMETQKTQSDLGRIKRKVRLSLPLAIVLLSVGYAIFDLVDSGDKLKQEFVQQRYNVDTSTRVGRINVLIRDQVRSLQGIDPGGLTGSFGYFLNTYNCPFFIRCERADTLPENSSEAERIRNVAEAPPARSFIGSVWHVISATPQAVYYTAGKIRKAGNWAIAMFVSCTILWFALLVHEARGSTPIAALAMFVGAPAGIGLMVILAQRVCAVAMNTLGFLGCVLAVLVMAVIHGTAVVVVVGSYHLSKGPREVAEGIAKIREI